MCICTMYSVMLSPFFYLLSFSLRVSLSFFLSSFLSLLSLFSRSKLSVFFFFCCLDLTSDLFPSRSTGCFFLWSIIPMMFIALSPDIRMINFPRWLEIIARPLINHTCYIIVITELLMILFSLSHCFPFLSPAWWCCIVISNDVASTN